MCVSTAPADFYGTTIYLGKRYHPAHGWVFVMGYQNTAQNLSAGPNAMLLHLPAIGMSQSNFLDMHACRSVLKDMVTAVMPRSRGVSFSFGTVGKGLVQVFDHDIYTVVLATDASLIPNALAFIPAHKRIAANQPLFNFYAEHRPGYAVALCCFDNQQAKDAAPLLLWYKPMNPDYFLLPALDCHTGAVPSLQEQVEVDHWILLGSDEMREGNTVTYTDRIPGEVSAFLPRRVIGKYFSGRMRNGDFGISHDDVNRGDLRRLERVGAV